MACTYIRNTASPHVAEVNRLHRIALLNYREDGTTPYITVWKHGLQEMKV